MSDTMRADALYAGSQYVFSTGSDHALTLSSDQVCAVVTFLYDGVTRNHSVSCLFAHIYELAIKSVTRLLGCRARDRDLVADLAVDTWLRLCEEGRLERFDPGKSSLPTYVNRVAAEMVHRRQRTDRAHGTLIPFGSAEPEDPNCYEGEGQAILNEFASTLTGSQLLWWQVAILGQPMPAGKSFSADYCRELRAAVSQRCRDFVRRMRQES